jgi:hypothetical protein
VINPSALGAAAGASGSLAGQLLGGLDAPRRWLWGLIPGLHHDDTGEALTPEEAGQGLFGDSTPLTSGLSRLAGIGLATAIDPLTFALGPLAGALGGKAAATASAVGLANRAGAAGLESIPALTHAAEAAGAAAKAVPTYETLANVAGRQIPTQAVQDALMYGNLGSLRRHGGVSGLGTVLKRPQSEFLVNQLERQGLGSSLLDEAGNVTDKLLLSGDPEVRRYFAPRGGHLRQLDVIPPDFKGPLYGALHEAPPMPSLGEALGGDVLDKATRKNPLLQQLMHDPAMSWDALHTAPADEGARILQTAADETQKGVGALAAALRGSTPERLWARYLTRNPLGV